MAVVKAQAEEAEESGVRHRGDSEAKAAEGNHQGCMDEAGTDNVGGSPGAVGAAQQSAGAHDEPA